MSSTAPRTPYLLSVAAGLLLGGIYTLAPLMVWALVAAADEVMRRSGVARPDRWVALYVPGFGSRTSGE